LAIPENMKTKKLIQIGAGKIGRSFIAQVFSQSGYETVFVDINPKLISQLNERKYYNVVIKSDDLQQIIRVDNIRAIHFNETKQVVNDLVTSDIACISAGQKGMMAAIPLLANATIERYKKGLPPLDVILAENIRNADQITQKELHPLLPPGFPNGALPGLIETSIGKMVPIMSAKDLENDPLQVFAEPYNTLIVAKNSFKNSIPDIPYLTPKSNIKAWVDRKLFIHNLGHSTLAWLAFARNPSLKFIWEAVSDDVLRHNTEQTMLQSAHILHNLYPSEFSLNDLQNHINDLLKRFSNKALGDTIFRVGCDLYRKLGPNDRVASPLKAAIINNLPYDRILNAWLEGTRFRASNEEGKYLPSDIKFFAAGNRDPFRMLQNIAGFSHREATQIASFFSFAALFSF
jgi:mannitol-1-phosphate 5-dehydrogenase